MSQEILRALTQLFAIITKQDEGATATERDFVQGFFRQELDQSAVASYMAMYDQLSGFAGNADEKGARRSVKDSVQTLNICKTINKTLTKKQKVIVVVKLLELVGSDHHFTPNRMEIISTVSSVFNIGSEEFKLLEMLVTATKAEKLDHPKALIFTHKSYQPAPHQKYIPIGAGGIFAFIRIASIDSQFVKYEGEDLNTLNGQALLRGRVYLFSPGSIIKTTSGDVIYYSDVVSAFNESIKTTRLSYQAVINEYRFPNGAVGLRNIQIAEGPGQLIGIMGASGAGKTTLLNVLAGLEKPTAGYIKINGFDLTQHPEELEGVVGYVSQDDLLIEELTVYENLFYNARLCFDGLSEQDLKKKVDDVLEDLGLDSRKDLKVGSVLDKVISGGQRKRLNIALELIREPAVLFLDEPTSGLSSRDSENVIDLLKELSLKGKLVFVVIHQPSSDIYKMFDKMIIMDFGGYPVYSGAPVEAITWFKQAAHQVDSHRGQCETCGNVNPEQIFSIIEAKVVDEFGQITAKRKVNPSQWYDHFRNAFKPSKVQLINDPPVSGLRIPGRIKQSWIFLSRDLMSKISNRQYLLINFLEAPVLAFLLSFIIKYLNSAKGTAYALRFNENLPAYFLMAVIVALFMGLTVSAEEIIRDRKILKRESFLNLSRNSYLTSKVLLLFGLSAIQTLTFVLIGNYILEIREMNLAMWAILFSASCFANVLGLNISDSFNSAVTVYILIPLLLIPQMVLSGVLFSFDKLNPYLSAKGKVPVIADFMVSRWSYEALAVYQYKENPYMTPFYDYEKAKADADYQARWLSDELRERLATLDKYLENPSEQAAQRASESFNVIARWLRDVDFSGKPTLPSTLSDLSQKQLEQLDEFLTVFENKYQDDYNKASSLLEKKMDFIRRKYRTDLLNEQNTFFNQSMADLVRNVKTQEPVTQSGDRLIRQTNPVFMDHEPSGPLDYRAPFFVPFKNWLGIQFSTLKFNLLAIWMLSAVMYISLYFRWFHKVIAFFGRPASQD